MISLMNSVGDIGVLDRKDVNIIVSSVIMVRLMMMI